MIQRAVDQVQLADFGIVRAVNPLSVELGYQNEVLDSDELIVSQGIRQYDKDVGLKVGDTLVLVPTESEEFIAVGLISDTALGTTVTSATMTAAVAAAIATEVTNRNAAIATQAATDAAALTAALAAADRARLHPFLLMGA